MPANRILLAAFLFCAPLLHAQNADSPEHKAAPTEQSYLLTVTLKVTDHGKKSIDQTYALAASQRNGPSVRDGDRIPLTSGSEGNNTQIQYIDIGTNIDFRDIHPVGSSVGMIISIENSSVAPDPADKSDPIIRQTKYSINPIAPIGKLITIYSSGDGVSGHKVEIQLLVQPLTSQ